MATRKDVAEKAGVSVAAVSYVLNGKGGVSEATRLKVLQAIEELNYKPSFAARSLKMKRSEHLAVFVNYLGDPFEAGLLLHLEERAGELGYYINFQTYRAEREQEFRRFFSGRIDGLILLGQSLQAETAAALQGENVPVVSIGRPMYQHEAVKLYADIDWNYGMGNLVRHLKREGHVSIGFMENGRRDHVHERRKQAFLNALAAEGLGWHEANLLSGKGKLEGAQQAMTDYIARGCPGDATAFVAASDLMAVGMLTACRLAGISVPGQLAIAGCENLLMTMQTSPAVTVLNYPRKQAATEAMDRLAALIRGESATHWIGFGDLLPRASSHTVLGPGTTTY